MDESQTFKTGLNLESHKLYTTNTNEHCFKNQFILPTVSNHENEASINQISRLPHTVNLLTLKEMLLSDAPFVSRLNRSFWKKWLDTKAYSSILSALYYVISGGFSDNGTVNVDIFYDLSSSSLYNSFIAKNLVSLYILENVKVFERDRFFSRFPEILCYMTINALATAIPKHHRVYSSIKFREILLDFMLELICGMKPINIQINREWLFLDAIDTSIFLVTKRPSILQSSVVSNMIHHEASSAHKTKKEYKNIRSWYTLEHSPLITSFLDINNHDAHRHDTHPHMNTDKMIHHKNMFDNNNASSKLNNNKNLTANIMQSLKDNDSFVSRQPTASSNHPSYDENSLYLQSPIPTHRTIASAASSTHDIPLLSSRDNRASSVLDRLKALGREPSSSYTDPSNDHDIGKLINYSHDDFDSSLSPLSRYTMSRQPSLSRGDNATINSSRMCTPSSSKQHPQFTPSTSLSLGENLSSPNYDATVKPISRLSTGVSTLKSPSYVSHHPSLTIETDKLSQPISQSRRPYHQAPSLQGTSLHDETSIHDNTYDNTYDSIPRVNYLDKNMKAIKTKNPLAMKLELTHPPNRELFNNQSSAVASSPSKTNQHHHSDNNILKYKEKINMNEVRDYLRQSTRQRYQLIHHNQHKMDMMNHDMNTMKKNLKTLLGKIDHNQAHGSTEEVVDTMMTELKGKGRITVKTSILPMIEDGMLINSKLSCSKSVPLSTSSRPASVRSSSNHLFHGN